MWISITLYILITNTQHYTVMSMTVSNNTSHDSIQVCEHQWYLCTIKYITLKVLYDWYQQIILVIYMWSKYVCRDSDHNTHAQSSHHIYVISYHKIYIQRHGEICTPIKSTTKDDGVKVDSTWYKYVLPQERWRKHSYRWGNMTERS